MKAEENTVKRMIQKCKAKGGETITEVLVASLVIAFGSILLASMVTASTKIIQKSMVAYNHYMDIHNGAESLTSAGLSALMVEKLDGSKTTLEAVENDGATVTLSGDIGLYGRKLNTGSDGMTKTYVSDGPYKVSVNESSVKAFTVPKAEETSKYSFTRYFVSGHRDGS